TFWPFSVMLPKPRISLVRRLLYLLPAGAIFDSWSLCLQAASDNWTISASERLAAFAMSAPADSRPLASIPPMLLQPARNRLAVSAVHMNFILLFIEFLFRYTSCLRRVHSRAPAPPCWLGRRAEL